MIFFFFFRVIWPRVFHLFGRCTCGVWCRGVEVSLLVKVIEAILFFHSSCGESWKRSSLKRVREGVFEFLVVSCCGIECSRVFWMCWRVWTWWIMFRRNCCVGRKTNVGRVMDLKLGIEVWIFHSICWNRVVCEFSWLKRASLMVFQTIVFHFLLWN